MRNYAENGELCGIVRRTENCAISHSPHLNVASEMEGLRDTITKRNEGKYLAYNVLSPQNIPITTQT